MVPDLPGYPAVRFIMRNGSSVVIGLCALPILLAVVAVMSGLAWWWLVVAAAATPILYLFARSYVELVRIIGDTLLPR